MGPRGWLRMLFAEGRWVETLFSAVGVIGLLVTGADILTRLHVWVHGQLAQFALFLWVSLIVLSVNSVAWVVLYRRMRHEVNLVTRRTELGRQAAEVQHRMAEAVRRCAHDAATYDLQKDIVRVMAQLLTYLRLRLGERKLCITVKRTVPGANGRLQKVFRDADQDLETRCRWDDIALDDSAVYRRFTVTTNTRKVVFIGDTNTMPATEDSFRDRAKVCGYRTVIGFPLRLPAPIGLEGTDDSRKTSELKVANLLGFLSIDAPDVEAFEGLLKPKKKPKTGGRQPGTMIVSHATTLMFSTELPIHWPRSSC